MNGLPRRSLGPHGWQPAGDSSPQLEQFICCNYWQDNAVGTSGGRLGMGPGPGHAQRHIHTLGDVLRRRSQDALRSHTQDYTFPHPRGHAPTCPQMHAHTPEPTPELSDGTHTCLTWQKEARGVAMFLGMAQCHSVGEMGL